MKQRILHTGKFIYFGLPAILFLLAVLFSGCGAQETRTVVCGSEPFDSYAGVLSQTLPCYSVRCEPHPDLSAVNRGAALAMLDMQADAILKNDPSLYWYPQALATVVIAVDRDLTDTEISGWSDLPSTGQAVAYNEDPSRTRLYLAAIAYGLGDGNFSMDAASGLLAELYRQGSLASNSCDCPIVVCFDYEAAAMAAQGRDMEIVVPDEGTLSFEMGLLSREKLSFQENSDELLKAAGFRLLSGESGADIFPDAESYASAEKLVSYGSLNEICQDATRILRRNVRNVRMYSTADQREHMLMAVCYMILVTLWIGSIIGRAMNRNVRRTAMLTGLFLIGWAFLRFIKYQLADIGVVNRYCWYGFYLFELSIPLLMLFLAWSGYKKDERMRLPLWLKLGIAANAMLFLLIMTNDLHGLVFKLDLTTDSWSDVYSYGIGYYVAYACIVVQILASIAMLIYKSWKSPHRKAVVFPICFCLFVLFYSLSYANRVPWAWEMDLTMTIGFITLLFFESAMRTGLVPVNTRYAELFKRSTLKMQIVDRDGKAKYRAANAPELDRETLQRLSAGTSPIRQDENTLLYTDRITGGTAVWQEDISNLNRLLKELEHSADKLRTANAILSKESEVRRRMLRAEESSRLFTQLEEEIAEKTALLSRMIRELPEQREHRRAVAAITLLLCYIKRRCNLFFMEREQDTIAANNLMTWIDELAEYAKFTGLPVLTRCTVRADIPARQTTLFYDFFYAILSWECRREDGNLLEQMDTENGRSVMKLMFPAGPEWPELSGDTLSSVAGASGTIRRQDLEDTYCIQLSFPE